LPFATTAYSDVRLLGPAVVPLYRRLSPVPGKIIHRIENDLH